jgi:hypothetical protein
MNRSNYFKEISELYGLNDQSKFLNAVEQINLFICNLSLLLRFAFYIYFLILRLFPSSLYSRKIINYFPKVLGLRSFHELCVNIFIMAYYDDA